MNKNGNDDMEVLRLAEVIEKTGLARSTIYKYADPGRFPRPISLGGKSVGNPSAKNGGITPYPCNFT
tara:strand:+ start:389 stop:589 length:201 start_codon:yes stop_codon:yes gene_type:complete